MEINSDDMKMVFSNLGVQCVKKRDIEEALRVREEIRVDPFRSKRLFKSLNEDVLRKITYSIAGYAHRSQPSSIDLNAVRLCFQVFLEGPQKGKFTTPVKPVVSDPIFDKKSTSDLVITKLSHCNAICNGGQEMILLCEKVTFFLSDLWLFFVNLKFSYRFQRKIFKCDSTTRLVMAGKVLASSNIHRCTSRLRSLLEHLATNQPISQIQLR